ncbi:uncharacterized protein LOC142165762 [Nicotiana tabacum]|uniref:Uncharacterized protein LOC142165762 n=1 Tax=Nicotiana tabacum TaxID=4097 RepID=A0AC58S5M1_TOBAC
MEDLKEKSEAITYSNADLDHVENVQEKPVMIRWKSGKEVDPRLIMLLDFFRDLYLKRGEFFKKIFPLDHEDFIPVFEKIGAVFSMKDQEKKSQIIGLERSPSESSLHRSRGIDESQLKLERFKVKTPEVQSGGGGGGGGGGGASGGQGSTKASGSK